MENSLCTSQSSEPREWHKNKNGDIEQVIRTQGEKSQSRSKILQYNALNGFKLVKVLSSLD